ncbi:MAG: AraC family transcriptional regulator [Sphaerochaeta sp.]|nr:AraC family transcriptional regulator [Sphaerochaeta sp.]
MIVQKEQKLAVQRMLDHIDSHLTEPISLRMLADAAQYSPWHCARMFKEATGMAPFTYLRHRRLSEAARRLGEGGERIVDVAFDFVFDSHEGFTRAFSRQFGMSPQEFRQKLARNAFIKPPRCQTDLARITQGERVMNTVFVQVVERPERKVVVRFAQKATHYFEYCEEVGCDVWDILSGIKEALYEPMGMWMPANMRKMGIGEYAQGVEVPLDYEGEIPAGFECIELPECKMMVFQGPPFEEERFEDAITDLWEVMKSYDPGIYGFTWADEDGPRFQLAPLGYRGYIEARPVRQVNR